MEAVRAKYKLPALGAVALRGDAILAEGYVGVRKLGDDTPVTSADRFHLGSDTKAMTATLFGILVDQGKVKWTTTLGEAFAGSSIKLHPDWKDVTLAQVLAHRAGLRSNILPAQRGPEFMRLKMPQRREVVLGEILSQPPTLKPGSKYEYSNVGYILIGSVIERNVGQSWEDAIQERLFKPLGITTAGFGPPGTPGKIDQPWGHTGEGKPMDPGAPGADNPRVVGPAGTANMTLRDWSKFIALHLRGDARNPERAVRLVEPATMDRLHTPAAGDNYTAGWITARAAWAKGSAKVTRAGLSRMPARTRCGFAKRGSRRDRFRSARRDEPIHAELGENLPRSGKNPDRPLRAPGGSAIVLAPFESRASAPPAASSPRSTAPRP